MKDKFIIVFLWQITTMPDELSDISRYQLSMRVVGFSQSYLDDLYLPTGFRHGFYQVHAFRNINNNFDGWSALATMTNLDGSPVITSCLRFLRQKYGMGKNNERLH